MEGGTERRRPRLPASGLAGTWSLDSALVLPAAEMKLVGTDVAPRLPYGIQTLTDFSLFKGKEDDIFSKVNPSIRFNLSHTSWTTTKYLQRWYLPPHCAHPGREQARVNQSDSRSLAPKHTCRRRASRAPSAKDDQRQALRWCARAQCLGTPR